MERDAYDEGYEAARAGASEDDNPYIIDGDLADELNWADGWATAKEDLARMGVES